MDNSNNKYVIYDEVYFTDVEKQIISAFQDGSSLLSNIDIPWMIKCFMKSTHRKKVEQGHPYWIGKIGAVVIVISMVNNLRLKNKSLLEDL